MGVLDLNTNWPPNTSARPVLVDLPDVVSPGIPVYNIPDPDINLPDKPDMKEVKHPGEGPIIKDVVIPPKPEYEMPPIPVLEGISLPATPKISLPEFDIELQDEVFSIPPSMNFQESPFNSDIWQQLLTKVVEGVRDGGQALEPAVEAQIWKRVLLRNKAIDQKAYEELENHWSAKGWDMPQGSLAEALQDKADEIARGQRDTSLEIGVTQAKLAHEDTRFVMQLAKDSEVILRDFHNNQMNRKLEAEKSVAKHAIDILNAHVSAYNVRIMWVSARSRRALALSGRARQA